MLNVVETFSGIGAQAKALERSGIEYKILATAEWDVNAIVAYDLIHNGQQDLSKYNLMTKKEIIDKLGKYTLSPDGKEAYNEGALKRANIEILKRVLCSIDRCNNLVSITDIRGEDLPDNMGLLTYSFPCQDLSIAGVWHGNITGIDRDANNRSGLLWEVERILKERVAESKSIPQFLLMENVKNIQASRHKVNFKEWIDYLESIGYYCKTMCLNASKFGIPQNRKRVYMLSIYIDGDLKKKNLIDNYFLSNDLSDDDYVMNLPLSRKSVKDIIKLDYEMDKYRIEANMSQLHDTPSRHKIIDENDKIFENGEFVSVLKTITTKQDRNPNSGVIEYKFNKLGKLNYRYLTPRECFLAMGFEEEDYEILVKNNIQVNKNRDLFSQNKLVKMAGNSIVVNVLEAIFIQIDEIKRSILDR